jgi:hypothetical protein
MALCRASSGVHSNREETKMYREAEKIRDSQRKESRSFKVEQYAQINEQASERAEQARHFIRAFNRKGVQS